MGLPASPRRARRAPASIEPKRRTFRCEGCSPAELASATSSTAGPLTPRGLAGVLLHRAFGGVCCLVTFIGGRCFGIASPCAVFCFSRFAKFVLLHELGPPAPALSSRDRWAIRSTESFRLPGTTGVQNAVLRQLRGASRASR